MRVELFLQLSPQQQAVTGFNASQIFALLINNKIEDFTEIQMDLGTSFLAFHNPYPKKINKTYEKKNKKKCIFIPEGWSIWDNIIINGPMTLNAFLEYMDKKYKIIIRGIYTQNMESIKDKNRINENLEDIYCKLKNKDKNKMRNLLILYLDAKDEKKNTILMPSIVYKF